ncbi:MAG TPA: hypothetical protein VE912_14050 [Bacteroidales bacterium]|nr:hypothetical protein [Bacteroidales bacterium]
MKTNRRYEINLGSLELLRKRLQEIKKGYESIEPKSNQVITYILFDDIFLSDDTLFITYERAGVEKAILQIDLHDLNNIIVSNIDFYTADYSDLSYFESVNIIGQTLFLYDKFLYK